MIDFHCHLDLYSKPFEIAQGCAERGIYVLSVTTTPSAWQRTNDLAINRIRTALGLHPQLAHQRKYELEIFDELLQNIRYVGEIGLDGAPEFSPYWNDQCLVFNHILDSCARAGGRIMSIHSRRASESVLNYLEVHMDAGIPILHWFTGSFRDLNRAIEFGCWFSVGPAMLNSKRGKEIAIRIPTERILTESDGPFAHINGRPIMPWEVDKAVVLLADLWGSTQQEAQITLHENFSRLLVKLN